MKKNETVLSVKKENELFNKKVFAFFVVLLVMSVAAFAADTSAGATEKIDGVDTIKKVFGTIYAFFTSAAIRVIAIAGVVYTGVKIITNKGNPEAIKPLVGILIACILIGSASWFVDKFMGGFIKKDVESLGSWY